VENPEEPKKMLQVITVPKGPRLPMMMGPQTIFRFKEVIEK
jgi:hypothetical protein